MSATRSAAAAEIANAATPSRACDRGPEAGRLAAVRGIVFDAPDVLYDATVWRRWLWRLLSQLGVSPSYDQFCRTWDAHYLFDVHCGRREFTEAFESFLLSWGLTWGQIDEVEAASRIQLDFELHVRPLPGVVKTVSKLVAVEVPLVAWADLPQPGAHLAEFFGRLGLGNCFRAVVTSLDCENAQPAAECYQAMLAPFELPPEEVLYVGHDTEHLAAARSHGFVTAAVNFAPPVTADVLLARCEDLLRLPLVERASLVDTHR